MHSLPSSSLTAVNGRSCTAPRGPQRSSGATPRDPQGTRRWAAGLLIGGAVALAGTDASAFCRSTTCRTTATKKCETDIDGCTIEGAKLWWPTNCVSYAPNEQGTLQLDPADSRLIIRKAFETWSDVPCPAGGHATMTFQERDPVACKKSEYNKTGRNLNVVLFRDDYWNYRGIDGTLAKTSVTYNDDTGEIYDADIEVNAAFTTITITDNPKKVDYDLQSILTHEVGHFIGIAHAPRPNTVMFASYSEKSIGQRHLAPDDVDAVCAIYPPGANTVCNTEPRGGFSATCNEDDGSSCSVGQVGAPSISLAPQASGLAFLGLGMLFAVGTTRALRGRRSR